MTGTGTQADPYIPTTLTEFITAVGTSGAYVTLTQDINAADDPEYSGELTTAITINAKSVEGVGYTVSGVTVRANRCIYIGVFCYVYNLNLRDFCLKANNSSTFIFGEGSNRSGLIGCTFAAKIDGLSQFAASGVRFTSCAADIKLTMTNSTVIFNNCAFDLSTTRITGANLKYSGSIQNTAFVRSALIFSGYSADNHVIFHSGSMSYSYVCFQEPVDTTIYIGTQNMTVSIVATTEGQAVSAPSGAILATLDQMKDKDWLTSVGFLP